MSEYSLAPAPPAQQTGGMLPGYRPRRATPADAQEIFDLVAAHEIPLIGAPSATIEDVADELVEPDFDLDTDGWLVHDEAGQAVGWGWACRKGTSSILDISVYVRPGHDALAGWLWERAEQRAVEIARQLGHGEATLDIGIFPNDELLTGLAAQRGFSPQTTFVRMRIDHTGEVPHPRPPAEVSLGHGDDPRVRRHVVEIRNEAFADHFGFAPKTYDDWAKEREASSAHDWRLIHVAYVAGEPAACLVRTNNFVPDENCGYVLTLGTVPRFQGRGLGGYLLRHAFAEDAAQGRAGTILHVDTNPKRPALRLYQRHGMRAVLKIDAWQRTLPV